MLKRLGGLCDRRRGLVLAIWLLIAAGLFGLGRVVPQEASSKISLPGSGSQQVADLIQHYFPADLSGTSPVVFRAPPGVSVQSLRVRRAIQATTRAYRRSPLVASATPPFGSNALTQLNVQKRVGVISVRLTKQASNPTFDQAKTLIGLYAPLQRAGLDVAAAGAVGAKLSEPSSTASVLAGLVAAALILILSFGAVAAAAVPILTALLGLASALTLVALFSNLVNVPSATGALATMIGLGVGIDYALFMVSRHRRQLEDGAGVSESIAAATALSGRAILIAGSTVVIALVSLAVAGIPLVTTLGLSAAIAVVVAVAAALTLLPSLLALLGRRINAIRIPGLRLHHDDRPHGWQRWANWVSGHPWPALLCGLVALVVLALPAFSLRLGQPDNGDLPKGTESRQAYDLLSDGFGAGANGPIIVATEAVSHAHPQLAPLLAPIYAALFATADVDEVAPPSVAGRGRAAVYTVVPKSSPSAPQTADLVNLLRSSILPRLLGPAGVSGAVGGSTAAYIDLADEISAALPAVIAVVLALSFVLLLSSFRSLAVAVKAVALNVLSILAAFGILAFVFGHSWSASFLGLDGSVPVVSFVPLMMFAILFGLSMDYEVFLMTNMREAWRSGGDARGAVIDGLARTGRVITSAALIMVAVFLAFVLNANPTVKQFGLGMAAAVAVDATIVRCLMVPAIMTLLGPRGWWLPARLGRLLPGSD